MEMRLCEGDTVKEKLVQETENKRSNGRHILTALLACIKFLAKRNLAFQGSSDRVDDYTAQGNFLSLVKLIAEFDPILKVHLKKFGGKGSATNLSNITQNKFIALLADEVCQNLVRAVEEGKYFGFMWDSTPDISHRDQHALVTRHVTRGEVKESFLGFFEWMEKPVNCVWNLGRCKETSTEVQGLQGNLIRQRKCDGGCENRR